MNDTMSGRLGFWDMVASDRWGLQDLREHRKLKVFVLEMKQNFIQARDVLLSIKQRPTQRLLVANQTKP